jgi:hypothetical protein
MDGFVDKEVTPIIRSRSGSLVLGLLALVIDSERILIVLVRME